MIIEAREDVVTLRGNLLENMWPAIQAAANLLLKEHPSGIIIDCGHLETASGPGVQTLVDAMNYIQKQGARILLADVPEEVMQVLRAVPGAGSQLPVARTVDEARRSLELEGAQAAGPAATEKPERILLVPVVEILHWEHGISLACRLAAGNPRTQIHLVYILEVPLSLPLGAALPDQEQRAAEALKRGRAFAHECGTNAVPHVERARELAAGLLQASKEWHADVIVAGVRTGQAAPDPRVERVLSTLLQKADCEVVIDRARVQAPAGL